MLPPLTFDPLLKRIRWGGRKLGSLLTKPIGEHADYAESWEVADHADGQSLVANGMQAGRSLSSVVAQHGPELLGTAAAGITQFPLLIKYLDANDWLSLQVHPDDELARDYSPTERGKTEAWVIIDAEPGSRLCAGLRSEVTATDLRQGLTSGDLEPLLNLIPVKPGDCLFVPAGTVHALGPGIVLAEIQQQSNLTFRLHDWGRVDAQGRPRSIHVEDSLRCTDFSRGPLTTVKPVVLADGLHRIERLVDCEHFVIHRHQSSQAFEVAPDGRFRILMMLEGAARLLSSDAAALSLPRGATVLLPACLASATIEPLAAGVTLLEVFRN